MNGTNCSCCSALRFEWVSLTNSICSVSFASNNKIIKSALSSNFRSSAVTCGSDTSLRDRNLTVYWSFFFGSFSLIALIEFSWVWSCYSW